MYSWMKNVRQVEPYVPGEQPKCTDLIKLNTNECPYPPAPGVEKKLKEFKVDCLRLYPDPEASVLTSAIADYYQVKQEEVFVGVGSDDVLGTAFLTFFNSEKPILFPNITYSFYPVWASLYGIPYETPKLREDFTIRKEDYFKENGGIVIANPNAPTGLEAPLSVIEEIVAKNPDVVVIVDEAYVDFGASSAYPLVEKYDNLLVVQTFSKSRAMAGMRIGFAIGNPKLIACMNAVKFSYNSYTMNQTTLTLGVEAIKDDTYFKETLSKIMATRERSKKELKELGFSFPDSRTNFIFASHKKVKAKEIFEYLKSKNIFVRYFNQPLIDNYLRITIGTEEEMDRLFANLHVFLDE